MPENAVNKELLALIQLMDEPDENIFSTIRKKIMDYGPDALSLLEEAWVSLNGEVEQSRVEHLVQDIRLEDVSRKLSSWSSHRSLDLFEPYGLISIFHQADESLVSMEVSVYKIYRDLWLEMNDELTALEKIRVVNHIFFDVYRFQGLQSTKAAVPTYMLGNVLRTQKGNPLSLAMTYLMITQQLGLPVFGVDLPHHFILAYMDDSRQIKPAGNYTEDEVLFYVNPFNQGAIFRKSEIELFIKQLNIKEQNSFFLPCDNLSVIRRMLNDIQALYRENNKTDKADALKQLLKAVSGE